MRYKIKNGYVESSGLNEKTVINPGYSSSTTDETSEDVRVSNFVTDRVPSILYKQVLYQSSLTPKDVRRCTDKSPGTNRWTVWSLRWTQDRVHPVRLQFDQGNEWVYRGCRRIYRLQDGDGEV